MLIFVPKCKYEPTAQSDIGMVSDKIDIKHMVQLILVQLPDFLICHIKWHLEPFMNNSHENNNGPPYFFCQISPSIFQLTFAIRQMALVQLTLKNIFISNCVSCLLYKFREVHSTVTLNGLNHDCRYFY